MRKFSVFLYLNTLILLLFAQNATGQKKDPVKYPWEYIAMAGTSHFLGDLGGNLYPNTNTFRDLNLQTTRYALGVGARFKASHFVAFRANLHYARVAGNDKYSLEENRKNRNLHFRSPIAEGNFITEFSLIQSRAVMRKFQNPNNVYLFTGIGWFYFNPSAQLDGTWHELQPLGTEGQGITPGTEKYSLTSLNIPIGIGYTYEISRSEKIGVELSFRKVFTDYIDDVSTNFYDNKQIEQNYGTVAARLADRSHSPIPGFSAPGAIRGDPDNMDNFAFLLFTYTKTVGLKASNRKMGRRLKIWR